MQFDGVILQFSFSEEEFYVKSHHHVIWRIFFFTIRFVEEEFYVKSLHHAIWRIFYSLVKRRIHDDVIWRIFFKGHKSRSII